mgnify:CR=1 FL=1
MPLRRENILLSQTLGAAPRLAACHLPRRDEKVTVGEHRLTVVEFSAERIRRLRVERIEDVPTL